VVLILLTTVNLCGCATCIINPIEKVDIFDVPVGSKIVRPNGEEMLVEKPGYFLSDYWLKKVAKAWVQ